MAKKVIQLNGVLPDFRLDPECLLGIREFEFRIDLKWNGGTVTCDTLEDVKEIFLKMSEEEIKRRLSDATKKGAESPAPIGNVT